MYQVLFYLTAPTHPNKIREISAAVRERVCAFYHKFIVG